jgi:hypothetical protein
MFLCIIGMGAMIFSTLPVRAQETNGITISVYTDKVCFHSDKTWCSPRDAHEIEKYSVQNAQGEQLVVTIQPDNEIVARKKP